jgi:hypothetical protein
MSDVVDQTRAGFVRAIAWGTLAVGLLDAADGVIFFGLHDRMNPVQVLQYIASGAFGAAAFSGGLPAALAGLVIHFCLAFVFTAAFVTAYVQLPFVRRMAIAVGLVYGAAVWLFMNLIVLPHSGVPQSPVTGAAVANGLISHALFVGLPAALAARRFIR